MSFVYLIWAVGLTLATWVALGALFVGAGLVFSRPVPLDTERVLRCFWAGFCVFLAALLTYHLWRPIDQFPLLGLAVAGLIGLTRHRRPIAVYATTLWRTRRTSSIVLALAIVLLANRAIGSPAAAFDTGLYHASAVRWAVTAPAVPGLANLHFRFGFNSSIHLYAAALTAGPWGDRACHMVNGLLLAAIGIQAAAGIRRLLRPHVDSDAARHVLDAAILPLFVLGACSAETSGFSTDAPVAALIAAAATRVPDLTLGADRRPSLWWITLLLSAAISVKLSAAPLGAFIGLAALVLRARSGVGDLTRALPAALVAGTAIMAPWMAHGIVLSGYPLFPSTVFGAAVSWRIPEETATSISRLIRTWAQTQTFEPRGDWTLVWARRVLLGQLLWVTVPMVLALCGLAVWARWRIRPGGPGLLLLACFAGIAVWLLTAPDPRFGAVGVWLLAASVLSMLAASRPRALSQPVAVGVLALAGIAAAQRLPLVRPGPDAGFHPMPRVQYRTFTTRSGLAVREPDTGTQCWDGPLPCSMSTDPGLRLRDPSHLAAGFEVDGGLHLVHGVPAPRSEPMPSPPPP